MPEPRREQRQPDLWPISATLCQLAMVMQGVASIVVSVQGHLLRGTVLAIGVPLWLIAAVVVAGYERGRR